MSASSLDKNGRLHGSNGYSNPNPSGRNEEPVPVKQQRFETFVMTGDMIIRTSSNEKASKLPVRQTQKREDSAVTIQRSTVTRSSGQGRRVAKQKSEKIAQNDLPAPLPAPSVVNSTDQSSSDTGSVDTLPSPAHRHTDHLTALEPELGQSKIPSPAHVHIDNPKTMDLKMTGEEPVVQPLDLRTKPSGIPVFSARSPGDQKRTQRSPSGIPVKNTETISPTKQVKTSPSKEAEPVTKVDSEITDAVKESQSSPSSDKGYYSPNGARTIPVVRSTRSQENCFDSSDLRLVSVDIDDKASSVDVLNYDDKSDSVHLASPTSRSVESSPEHKLYSPQAKQDHDRDLPAFIPLGGGEHDKDQDEESSSRSTGSNDGDMDGAGALILTEQDDNMDNNVEQVLELQRELTVIEPKNGDYNEIETSRDAVDGCVQSTHDSSPSRSQTGPPTGAKGSDFPTDRPLSPGSDSVVSSGSEDSDNVYFQPTKNADYPSAYRLAKRLYDLEGFKKADVAKHLGKKNDFSQLVAEEYLKFFDFVGIPLDVALRQFLQQFSLTGETQERERVLAHFTRRYMECNPDSFNSEDACHTLTCAIMLLNTDLHGQNIGRRMTCGEFIDNLAELNDGENFPRDVLKTLYLSIKSRPLEWALDEEGEATSETDLLLEESRRVNLGHNPFLDVPDPSQATEYKRGYVMRKCCTEPDGKKTPLGKRGWKMYYATLRDMVLYFHKDEHGFKKNSLYENLNHAVRIHHSLATKAVDYTKKQHVLRLRTAEWAVYLLQSSDPTELQGWIDTINFVAASLSAPPLPGGVGSQKKFQRPLLPSSYTRLNLTQQLQHHESKVVELQESLEEHKRYPPSKGAKERIIREYEEKEQYLHFELERFQTYAHLLKSKMASFPELESSLVDMAIGEMEEPTQSPSHSLSPLKLVALSGSPLHPTGHPVQRSLSDREKNAGSAAAHLVYENYQRNLHINRKNHDTYL
ncbi:PH and SEC7 domain-containing protein 1 isoform X2 [Lingula anatina]|uniref:PH and SEC7 domain-containing protein 1 isoform X2 n=1 Tax=Lingula anatina TaxID=7574 RepID=A0A1S3IPC6_LINAN|nr:PH and SEC7 domain-containing protein 1 isoform X2 [Lingula anatina]|eukprot:XP_013399761.1 PH and SEC7 domain-containing protein 1 isoform X2 [Lingula anatina]